MIVVKLALMKSLVLYDSQFGNTEKIAQVIANNIPEAKLLRVSDAKPQDLDGIGMLLVGSPTQGGRATSVLTEFLERLSQMKLVKVRVAVFDTRLAEKEQNFALRLLIKTIGYAAPKIADVLKSKGGELIVPPEGFFVKGKEGPLADGEIDRAGKWSKKLHK